MSNTCIRALISHTKDCFQYKVVTTMDCITDNEEQSPELLILTAYKNVRVDKM